jgi:hypothetical protein
VATLLRGHSLASGLQVIANLVEGLFALDVGLQLESGHVLQAARHLTLVHFGD